ncbi:MAG: CBS domain-containing protein [Desulfobacula sp.]|nr:CBS domain-containing protein [Desulfobacula sp.]
MIVKNWMSKNPDVITSDLLAKDAIKIFEEKRVPFISVVDDGKFKGLLARRDLREAANWTFAAQDVYETQYFNERLKVKDLMVRKPVTLNIDDTVDAALKKGKAFGRSFLPVMDAGKLVGTLSNRDFSNALQQLLGGDEGLHGICIEINGDTKVSIKNIMEEIFSRGFQIQGVFTLKDPDTHVKRLTIRFEEKYLKQITSLVDEKGYKLIEVVNH